MKEKMFKLSDVVMKLLAAYFLVVHLIGVVWFINDVGISSVYDVSIIASMLTFIFKSWITRFNSIAAILASIVILVSSILLVGREIFFGVDGVILDRISLYVIILVVVHAYAIFRFSCQLFDRKVGVHDQ